MRKILITKNDIPVLSTAFLMLLFGMFTFLYLLNNNLDLLPIAKSYSPASKSNDLIRIYALSSKDYSVGEINQMLKENFLAQLSEIKGVNRVVTDDQKSEIIAYLDPDKLDSHGITAIDVLNQIKRNDLDSTSGSIPFYGSNFPVRMTSFDDRTTFKNFIIRLFDGDYMVLDNIARIDYATDIQNTNFPFNRNSAFIYVYKEPHASSILVDKALDMQIQKIQHYITPSIKISAIPSYVDYSKKSLNMIFVFVFLSLFLVLFILNYFIRDFLISLVYTGLIMVAAVCSSLFMCFSGVGINSVTLFAILLFFITAIIDVLIYCHNKQRKNVDCFKLTLLTLFIYLGVMIFARGDIFNYLKSFAVTILGANIFLLVESYYLFPLISFSDFRQINVKAVISTKNCFSMLVVVLSLCFFYLFTENLFVPNYNKQIFDLAVTFPEGSSIDSIKSKTIQVYSNLMRRKDFTYFYGDIRKSIQPEHKVNIRTFLKHKQGVSGDNNLRSVLDSMIGAKFSLNTIDYSDGNSAPDIVININGLNYVDTEKFARKLYQEISDIKGITDLNLVTALNRSSVDFVAVDDRVIELGARTTDIAQVLNIAINGELVYAPDKDNVRVQFEPYIKDDINKIKRLKVPSYSVSGSLLGRGVQISNVSDIFLKNGDYSSTHSDFQNNIKIEGNLSGLTSVLALYKINNLKSLNNLPNGVTVSYGGNLEVTQVLIDFLIKNIITAFVIGVIIIFSLLRMYLYPFILMSASILVFVLLLFLLFVTGQDLNWLNYLLALVLSSIILKFILLFNPLKRSS